MSASNPLLQLHDLDLLLSEIRDARTVARLRRAGFPAADAAPVERLRARQLARLEPRWRHHYKRAQRRYGGAVATVRGRVCQGCFMTLPRSASPGEADAVSSLMSRAR